MTVQAAAQNKPRMLTRQEVAERLGVKVRWLEVNLKDRPSFYRLNGRTIRYAEKDVESWLRQRKVD